MFKRLKIKNATRRVAHAQKRAARMARPCVLARLWAWLRTIDVVGMINLTLLVAIIVLFSMLIIDVVRNTRPCMPAPTSAITPIPQVTVTDAAAPRMVRPRPVTRIQVSDPITRPAPTHDANKTSLNNAVVPPVKKYDQVGDIIIDHREMSNVLQPGARIQGNVYLQNMRKFTLPCGIYIDGNLFLRDMGMLRFCGDFTVTGNIYVSPRSSFGPIPRNARVGGHVIL